MMCDLTQQVQWRIQDFPEVGAPTPKVDMKGYYLANFFQKLHKIERIWTLRVVTRPWRLPPLRSANEFIEYSYIQ